MYLLSVFAFIIICIMFSIFLAGGNIYYYIDAPSIIVLLLLAIPVLISSGLLKDFNNAFRLSVKRNENCSRTELLRAIEAVSLAMKALLASGAFNSIFGIIHAAATVKDPQRTIAIAIGLITSLYALVFVILLLPLKSRLMVRLHELPEDPAASDTAKQAENSTENGEN